MTETVYRVTEIIGTSTQSWEEAAKNAVEEASKHLRDLRIAEISKLDMKIENGRIDRLPGTGTVVVQVRIGRLIGT